MIRILVVSFALLSELTSFAGPAGNLIADPGFESGTSGFTTPTAGDSVSRTTSNPIEGSGSLAVSLKSLGSDANWAATMPSPTNASQFTVLTRVRPDTISSWTTLQLCAEVVYADEIGILQKCTPVPTVPGQVNTLVVSMPLDPTKSVRNVALQVILRSATPVTFVLDDVSAELTP